MTRRPLEARAGVVTGTRRTTTREFEVVVGGGRLRISRADTGGRVLDVPLDRVRARALGRAGTMVALVDGAPVRVDFTRRDRGSSSVLVGAGYRVLDALTGWRVRRGFLTTLNQGHP